MKTYLLADAAAMVEEFVAGLDQSSSICECCGLTKRGNFSEFGAAQELEAVVRKLRRFEDQFRV